jgi:hypothetical protein
MRSLGGTNDWAQKQGLNIRESLNRFFGGQQQVEPGQGLGSRAYSQDPSGSSPELTTAQKLEQQRLFQQSGRAGQNRVYENITRAEEEAARVPTDWMAEAIAYQNQFIPDYSGIQDRWTDEANTTNARIQAMYDQIASSAGDNVNRISDIYSGASEGIGNVYDTASANTQAAYSSSQQQAADQMARLGIEDAAPNVLNPAALSQAEAIANLEAGRGSGQAATARFGASAGGFASQMAQVAQQDGAQYQTGVADELRRQMINLDMRSQQEAYQRAMQAPGLAQSLAEASQIGQPQGPSSADLQAQSDFLYRSEQDAIDNYDRMYDRLFSENPGADPASIHTGVRDYILTGAMGEAMRQWALTNPLATQ